MAVLDRKYYEVVPPRSAAERIFISARHQIFRDFLRLMRPTQADRILDVGVSDVLGPAANSLERLYEHRRNVTACGLGEAVEFQHAFPEVGYVRIQSNAPLPFADGSFDIAVSNAVLEHVGSTQNQAFFVSELCRVARRAFITVPNRWFPVEHHTGLPFVHYAGGSFRIACRATGRPQWAVEENLILMTRRRLSGLAAPYGARATIGYTGLVLGPFSSNLYLRID